MFQLKHAIRMKQQLVITALGVGHGDAILLTWGDGRDAWTCLVDGVESPEGLAAALDRRGVTTLDLLVLTHFDHDHLGGLRGLATTVKIREYWGPVLPAYDRHLWIFGSRCREAVERARALEEELAGAGVGITYPLEGYRSAPRGATGPRIEVLSPPARLIRELLTADDVSWLFTNQPTPLGWLLEPAPEGSEQAAEFEILDAGLRDGALTPDAIPDRFRGPTDPTQAKSPPGALATGAEPEFFGDSVLNNSSLVLWLEVPVGRQTYRVLFAADQENWTYLYGRNPRGLHADVLKASHHGGRVYLEGDVAPHELFSMVRPRAVLISANGRHKLPRQSFRAAAISWGASVFCTSQRGREVVLGPAPEGDCCHAAFGCSGETRDVAITLDEAGIHSTTMACHSGSGCDPGPVIQIQQHVVAPSRLTSRLLEHEMGRHVQWVRDRLREIHRQRATRLREATAPPEPVAGDTLIRLARECDPPRYDLIAHLDTILTVGAERGSFWAEETKRNDEPWHAYALPAKDEVRNYLGLLAKYPLILFSSPGEGVRTDPDTVLSKLDRDGLAALAAERLGLPTAAFGDTLWPLVCREFKQDWHCYELVNGSLALTCHETPKQLYADLLRRFVPRVEGGSFQLFVDPSASPTDRPLLGGQGGGIAAVESVLGEILTIHDGRGGPGGGRLFESVRRERATELKRLEDEVKKQERLFHKRHPEISEERFAQLLRTGIVGGDAEEARGIIYAAKRVADAEQRPEVTRLEATRSLALAGGKVDLVARALSHGTNVIW
jgi:beta-lactamase superfamily II metal-dependent hydrolase